MSRVPPQSIMLGVHPHYVVELVCPCVSVSVPFRSSLSRMHRPRVSHRVPSTGTRALAKLLRTSVPASGRTRAGASGRSGSGIPAHGQGLRFGQTTRWSSQPPLRAEAPCSRAPDAGGCSSSARLLGTSRCSNVTFWLQRLNAGSKGAINESTAHSNDPSGLPHTAVPGSSPTLLCFYPDYFS